MPSEAWWWIKKGWVQWWFFLIDIITFRFLNAVGLVKRMTSGPWHLSSKASSEHACWPIIGRKVTKRGELNALINVHQKEIRRWNEWWGGEGTTILQRHAVTNVIRSGHVPSEKGMTRSLSMTLPESSRKRSGQKCWGCSQSSGSMWALCMFTSTCISNEAYCGVHRPRHHDVHF